MYTVVTTAPRPIPTLAPCIASMRLAGFNETIHVLSDSERIDGDIDASILYNEPPLGGFRNWCKALDLGLASRHEWILICEDDILWCKDARAKISRDIAMVTKLGPFGYLSFYTCRHVSHHIERSLMVKRGKLPNGIYLSRLGWSTWGSQALLFSRESAIALKNYGPFQYYRDEYTKNRNRDAIVSRCLADMKLNTYFRVPSLVSHDLGNANSSLGNKPIQLGLLTDYAPC